jgi:ABC-type multidrug transport system fused ATPase/permease subunit
MNAIIKKELAKLKSIKKFSIHKTALTFACVMALSSLIFIIPMSLVFLNMPMVDTNGNSVSSVMPAGVMFGLPFFYLIMGYIMTAIGAYIYNIVSKYTGGIQFEVSEESNS